MKNYNYTFNTRNYIIVELKATSTHVDELLKMIMARKEQEDNDEKEFQVSIERI